MSYITCHVSHVTCHMSCVTGHVFFLTMRWSLSVEGLLSTGPTPSSLDKVQNMVLAFSAGQNCWETRPGSPVISDPPPTTLTTFSLLHATCNMWHVTCDTWHVKCDMWHRTREMWRMKHDMKQVWGVGLSAKISATLLLWFGSEGDTDLLPAMTVYQPHKFGRIDSLQVWRKRVTDWLSELIN